MAISLTSTNTSGAVNVNGVDVLTADATGNVSLRTAGATTPLADLRSIGIGQTWQTFNATQRPSNTTFTNTSGRPITILISTLTAVGGSGAIQILINGVVFVFAGTPSSPGVAGRPFATAIIPNNATYSAVYTGNGESLVTWAELRT